MHSNGTLDNIHTHLADHDLHCNDVHVFAAVHHTSSQLCLQSHHSSGLLAEQALAPPNLRCSLIRWLPDQPVIKLNKRVEIIEHTVNGVRVLIIDGTIEEGDIVIGADGVYSIVRSQMWEKELVLNKEGLY